MADWSTTTKTVKPSSLTIREKLALIEKLAAEVDAALPENAVQFRSRFDFGGDVLRTSHLGEPLDRIRRDAAKVLANLPRGTR